MRLPVEKIKEAILHPEEEVRLTAVGHFADSSSGDASIMPLVIQAVEKYGRDSAFRILRDAERLIQSASTLEWLINELRQEFDLQSVDEDNLRFALALVILSAPIDLLATRKAEIDALSNFPHELRGPLEERIQMATWTWEQAWQALEESGRQTMKQRDITSNEIRHVGRLIETLAQHPDRANWVIDRLRGQTGTNNRLMAWLAPEVINLAGEMRLESAIPILMENLDSEDASLVDAAATALMSLRTDAVVEAIANEWWNSDDNFRGAAVDVLEKIHTDLCVKKCLEFLGAEDDMDTAVALGHALLSHFAFEAIDPVRELVIGDDDDLSPNEFELRYNLTAAATIMGVNFPEYVAWHRDALNNNWGWGAYTSGRLADAFRTKPVRPKWLGTGEMRLPVEKIKDAILHSDRDVREAGLFYFAKARSHDPTIMPLVIQAIEGFGLDAFPILSAASSIRTLTDLVHTDDTVAWLIREIERIGSSSDIGEANYGASLIRGLRHADFAVLKRHEPVIQAMRALDDGSRMIIADRISVSSLTPDVLWRELIDFCDLDHDPEAIPQRDLEYVDSVVQALSHFPDQVADRVMGIFSDEDGSQEWLEGLGIRLAGELRLEAAIPSLVDRFAECGEWVCEEALEALAKIGTDAVVQEIAERYLESDWSFRLAAATMLEDIHTDLAVQASLDLFVQEQDLELQFHLLKSALMNFSPAAVEPARQYILNTPKTPDVLEVRAALLLACKLMEKTFPEFEEWLADSQHDTEFRKKWYENHPLSMADEEGFYDEELEDDEFADEALEEYDLEQVVGDEPPLTFIRRGARVGRNDPCPCGSGKKYKKCCYGKDSGRAETDEDHSTVMSSVRPLESPPKYPIGTVALYGPDDKSTTKIVAGVIQREGATAIVERWVGTSVKNNPKVRRQMMEFFDRYGVKSMVATETNFGCPHEEGLDFPSGEDCPFCPYWAGKQGGHRQD